MVMGAGDADASAVLTQTVPSGRMAAAVSKTLLIVRDTGMFPPWWLCTVHCSDGSINCPRGRSRLRLFMFISPRLAGLTLPAEMIGSTLEAVDVVGSSQVANVGVAASPSPRYRSMTS